VSKLYFIITRNTGQPTIVGVVANQNFIGSRPPTEAERLLILDKIKGNTTQTLADALRDDTYPNVVSVFDKRADQRHAVRTLRSFNSPHFTYHAAEVGDRERTATRPLGWRLIFDDDSISSYNHPDEGADVFLDGDSSNRSNENCCFSTRALAREAIKRHDLYAHDYTVVRVDA
jgi:hypothetical protein